MGIEKYFKEFNEANKAQDHYQMIAVMQRFFNEIHSADENVVLSYYSMASQFELFGINSKPIKDAVIARVTSQHGRFSTLWKPAAVGLNSLLVAEGRDKEQIVIEN